ncbi:MAG: YiiD C-terminal domain-containing protein [Deltaproteobacteria bacterium]|nr:YiiD C-terminal domain-containing protein [Deltaproteobacteria bacterium]
MTLDLATVQSMMEGGLPYVKKLGVKLEEGGGNRAFLRLPWDPTNTNHVGTLHAGALFTFAETAGGAGILFSFDLSKVRLLAKQATIEYKRLVTGDVTSEVVVPPADVARVMAEVDAGGRATYDLRVTLKDDSGEAAALVSITYHFKKL